MNGSTSGTSTNPSHQAAPFRTFGKIAGALAKAQGEFLPVLKTKMVDFVNNKNQRVKYSYADLADLIQATKAALSKHEIAVTHQTEPRNGILGMKTSIVHASGETLSTWYPLPDPMGMRHQEFGSDLTYARRYSLSMLLGIASEEDDDGHGHDKSTGNPPPSPPPPRQTGSTPSPIKAAPIAPKNEPQEAGFQGSTDDRRPTDAQIKRMWAIANGGGWNAEQVKLYCETKFGISSSKDLSIEQYNLLCGVMQGMKYNQAIIADFRKE